MSTLSASSTADGSISFREVSVGSIDYQIGTNGWNPVSSWPITIVNTDPSANLQILFITNVTMISTLHYFICGSTNIQFGRQSLEQTGRDAYRQTVTINTNNYAGLIKNGNNITPGYADIYIYNLEVNGTDFTLDNGAGWICQQGFGNGANPNYIINCLSLGNLPGFGSGGIVGSLAAISGGIVNIIGCTSAGSIGIEDGGIVGSYAGQNGGTVTCLQCWSTGAIDINGGGIYGSYAGAAGTAQAVKCYSTGLIGTSAGGIFGFNGGYNGGQAVADRSYSQGTISTNGGGIFGADAGALSGSPQARNCYSSGTYVTAGTGIYGSGKVSGLELYCYAANGSWNSSIANTILQGIPNPTVGTVWVSLAINQPYELNEFGHTPYSLTIINSDPLLIQSFSQTIEAGQNSISAINADASGNAFAILEIADGDSGSYNTISINIQSGVITTSVDTVPGTYTITLYSTGSYNITSFLLTVTFPTTGGSAEVSCCEVPLDLKGATYEMRYNILAGNSMIYQKETNPNFKNLSYSDIYKLRMAYAAKR